MSTLASPAGRPAVLSSRNPARPGPGGGGARGRAAGAPLPAATLRPEDAEDDEYETMQAVARALRRSVSYGEDDSLG